MGCNLSKDLDKKMFNKQIFLSEPISGNIISGNVHLTIDDKGQIISFSQSDSNENFEKDGYVFCKKNAVKLNLVDWKLVSYLTFFDSIEDCYSTEMNLKNVKRYELEAVNDFFVVVIYDLDQKDFTLFYNLYMTGFQSISNFDDEFNIFFQSTNFIDSSTVTLVDKTITIGPSSEVKLIGKAKKDNLFKRIIKFFKQQFNN